MQSELCGTHGRLSGLEQRLHRLVHGGQVIIELIELHRQLELIKVELVFKQILLKKLTLNLKAQKLFNVHYCHSAVKN